MRIVWIKSLPAVIGLVLLCGAGAWLRTLESPPAAAKTPRSGGHAADADGLTLTGDAPANSGNSHPPAIAAPIFDANTAPANAALPLDANSHAAEKSLHSLQYRGVALQLSGLRSHEEHVRLLREIADLGADTVLLGVAALMEHARAQAVYIDVRRTPAAGALVDIIQAANDAGLRVLLMPTVLLSHPRGSEWRGVIDPPDWKDWWRQYREILRYFADVARQGGAEGLLVGSELVSTERYTAEWVRTIEVAREAFPGKLGYSANWDHYRPIQFWDKLDFVGMTSYYTLADQPSPSVEQIVARWKPIRDEVLAWQARTQRPIVFTEVGWCSQEGAAKAPWNYYLSSRATPIGLEEQRRLYEAFVRAWQDAPGVGGVIWWEWTDGGGPADHGYTPKNKPAEQVLRAWFKATRPEAQ